MTDIAAAATRYLNSGHPPDMSMRQIAVMQIICDNPGPHNMRDLAKAIGAPTPSVLRAYGKLCGLGLARQQRGTDRRDNQLSPTDAGRDWREALRHL